MVFDPVTNEERHQFFRSNYGAHLPGYTGHCPTLKFHVGKRFGANTQEIIKELLEKKILKSGPYHPRSSERDPVYGLDGEKKLGRQYESEAHVRRFKSPFILGYTGYMPGFNNKYGLSFMQAVEEGGREWRERQNKLRARREAMSEQMERTSSRSLLWRARNDHVDGEIDHGHERESSFYVNQVSPEQPPIVGYTGHIPGARSEIALSRRYAQAARKGLELLQHERVNRCSKMGDSKKIQRVYNSTGIDDTGLHQP